MILEYDINRLLFLMRAAWQIKISNMLPVSLSNERLTIKRIAMTSHSIRIHLIEIGGRTYIGQLSDAIGFAPGSLPTMRQRPDYDHILSPELLAGIKRRFKLRYKDYPLDGITYIAMKSDSVGLVDVAFRCRRGGTPDWILNADTHSYRHDLSEIRYANVRCLLVISDVGVPSSPSYAEKLKGTVA